MPEHADQPPVFDAAEQSADSGTAAWTTRYDAAAGESIAANLVGVDHLTGWDESTGESFDLPVGNVPIEVTWDGRGVLFGLDYGDGLAASDDDDRACGSR